jgi:hypothetical protein
VSDVQSEILAKKVQNAWKSLQKIAEEIHQLSDDDWDDFHKSKLDGEEIELIIRRVEDRAKLLRSRFDGKGRW